MLRRTLLFLSERRGLRDLLLRVPALRRVAHRFVAGDTLEEALDAAVELNGRGLRVTLDYLGESVSDRASAGTAVRAYLRSLDAIRESDARSTISLKLTQLGLDMGESLCRENLRRILERARELDTFVRIDMESSRHTEATLRIFEGMWPEFGRRVGVVLQAYLRRSEEDARRMAELGAPVRLCKGAYDEPEEVAYQRRRRVDENFVRLLGILLEGGADTAVASHDEAMVSAAMEHMERLGMEAGDVEFQMLYGVRRGFQRRLVDSGHPVRVYVPYGSEWYPYLMRRMAERPANLTLVLRALLGDRGVKHAPPSGV